MSKRAILIDSNVIIYAINSSSSKHKAAQDFLQAQVGNMILAHQNIFESMRVLTHKKFPNPMTPDNAIKAIGNISERCHVISADQGAYHIALAFIKKHTLIGDKVFDAYLAATALSVGVKSIATDNVKDFRIFEGIKIVNPFN